MKKLCNYRVIVFSFIAMLFSMASILLLNFNRIYLIVLFTLSITLFLLFLFNTKKLKYIFIPLFLIIGLTIVTFYDYTIESSKVDYYKASIQGRVFEVRTNGVVIEDVTVANKKINGNMIIFTNDNFNIGDIIYSYEQVNKIEYDCTDSYINSLYDKNIFHSCTSDKFVKISTSKLSVSEKIKINTRYLYNKYLKKESGDIAYGMVFGDTSMMDTELRYGLSKTGLNHIFAVSGLHIGILASFIFWINKKLKIKGAFNIILTMVALILYNVLCGYSPSMVRATIMMLILLFGNEYGFKNDALSRLALSGIIILLYKPYSMFTISFQLSFFAVFGLITFGKIITNKLTKLPHKLASLIGASLSVNFAILPFIFYHFKAFPIWFLPANCIILPLLPVIYALTLCFTILELIFPMVNLLALIDYLFIPIKLVTILCSEVNISMVNMVFSGLALTTYLLAEVTISPYIFIKKQYKISIFTFLIILSLVFIFI